MNVVHVLMWTGVHTVSVQLGRLRAGSESQTWQLPQGYGCLQVRWLSRNQVLERSPNL